MRCPKCGYHSFETLDDCKKCGQDLQEHKGKYRIGGAIVAPLLAVTRGAQKAVEEPAPEFEAPQSSPEKPAASEEDVDFGFGLMDDEPTFETQPAVEPEVEPELEDAFSFSEAAEDESDEPFSAKPDVPDLSAIDDADDLFEPAAEEATVDFHGKPVEPAFDAVDAPQEPEIDDDPMDDLPETGAIGTMEDDFDDEDLDGINLDDLVSFDDEPITAGSTPAVVEEEAEPEIEPEVEEEALGSIESDPYEGITEIEDETPEDDAEAEAEAVTTADDEEDLFAFDDAGWRKGRNDQSLNSQALAEAEAVAVDPATVAGQSLFALDAGSNGVAGLGARIAATAFDLALLILLGAAFLIAGEIAMGKESLLPPIDALLTLGVYYYLVLFAWFFGYFTLFHFLSGETPGKMLFRIRVETVEGQSLSFSQAFLRSIGGLVSLIGLGLGYLMIMIDRQRRGWNDRIAGTHVVFNRSETDDQMEMA